MTGITFPTTIEGSTLEDIHSFIAAFLEWAMRIVRRALSLVAGKAAESQRTGQLDKFVVLAHQRTGSNLLCGMLHQHPQIYMHNELFNEQRPMTYNQAQLANWNFVRRDAYPREFLSFVWTGFGASEAVTCVGFKSFAEHWIGRSDLYGDLLSSRDVKKIILTRESPFEVCFSGERALKSSSYLNKGYRDVRVRLPVPKLNSDVMRYRDTYQSYEKRLQGQHVFRIAYEDLVGPKCTEVLQQLFGFLGVTGGIIPTPLPETIRQSNPIQYPMQIMIENYTSIEFAFRHTSYGQFLKPLTSAESSMTSDQRVVPTGELSLNWALLIPICSRQSTPDSCWTRLETFSATLKSTSSSVELGLMRAVVGIDNGDPVFDTVKAKQRIASLIEPVVAEFIMLDKALSGKVCLIWNHLASHAMTTLKSDLFLLLGDDIEFKTQNWASIIERKFRDLARERSLPLGAACVAFHDETFPGFPTFPVVHAFHLRAFDGSLLPPAFVNQDGDPFLFELYRRFGTSCILQDVKLANTIGGDSNARYLKQPVRFNRDVLDRALKCLGIILPVDSQLVCIDVCIPTYRCNLEILRRLTGLRASIAASVNFVIVVDDPNAAGLEHIKSLHRDADNFSVKVVCHATNQGASAARNTALNASNADWILFLDDDVEADSHLLDAYIGAVMRRPSAKVFVGLTELPPPCSMITEALEVSKITYFFTIAQRYDHPPWGVTANLMVKARTNRTRFDTFYPHHGGGEDVDFCIRTVGEGLTAEEENTNSLHSLVVAVPGAIVSHPWWDDESSWSVWKHVLGWAEGDFLCILKFPHLTYMTCPNWLEFLFLLAVFDIATGLLGLWRIIMGGLVAFTVDTALNAKHFRCKSRSWQVCFGASALRQGQSFMRFVQLIRRGSWINICRRMDFFVGHEPSLVLNDQIDSCMRFVVTILVVSFTFT